MVKIAIVVGSTRPGRKALDVANWVLKAAASRHDASFEVVDISSYNLPLLDEPVPPSQGQYANDHTKKWADDIATFDGFIFVTPEYNHGTSGALKNALDFVYGEWTNKAAAFVSYGSVGGTRAVEQLRPVMAELQIADVRAQVALPFSTDFDDTGRFTPTPRRDEELKVLLEQLVGWADALRGLRTRQGWLATS